MKLLGTQLRLSATDLSNHLACVHLTSLDRRLATRDLATPTRWDPMLSVLRERGLAHEAAFLDHLRSVGLRVVELEATGSAAEAATEVLHQMERGVDVIAQATLVEGEWLGIADVLMKVPKSSVLGDWSYEVMDTKLARETRGGTVLQLCLYTDLITCLQGITPEFMHVVSPVAGFKPESFRSDDFFAYYRLIRQRLERTVATNVDAIETYPTPTTHCDVCKWWERCSKQRRADDHLSLVAGMGRLHERELESWGVNRVRKLGQLETPIHQKPQRGSVVTFTRLREQARVQLATRDLGAIVYEPLPIEADRGLARLPEPSAGDIFLDFEGDPFAGQVPNFV